MITRAHAIKRIRAALQRNPVCALVGPRQCGKTTLARTIADGEPSVFYDLESVPDQRRLENAEFALSSHHGLVVLDEVQHLPSLLQTLRVLADRPDHPARFLILGSASPEIIRGASETLAGRMEVVDIGGFDLSETGTGAWRRLWVRGGFPRAHLAHSEEDSLVWREQFVGTFLQRDLPMFGLRLPPDSLRRFWTMLAHYHGQRWNGSELAGSMGVSDKTVRYWLDVLAGTFMARVLPPWHENVAKRQVKAPKVFLRDSGLLHCLLGLADEHALLGHPKAGASWEGFVVEQVLRLLRPQEAYHWAVHQGAELDLLVMHRGRRIGFECKFNDAPRTSASMRTAAKELGLEQLLVIHAGKHSYPMDPAIRAVCIDDLPAELAKLHTPTTRGSPET